MLVEGFNQQVGVKKRKKEKKVIKNSPKSIQIFE